MSKGGFTYSVELIPDIDKKVKQLGSVQAALVQVAATVAEAAVSMAPVGTTAEHDYHIGEYRDGISSAAAGEGAVVIASAPHSAWVEFGVPAHGIPPQYILRRAASAAGLTLS